MNRTTSMSAQKSKRDEYRDPDYQHLESIDYPVISKYNHGIQKPEITKMRNDCAASCNGGAQMDNGLTRMEEIIENIYNDEIAVRENQLSLIDSNLLNSRKLLERLRYDIVSKHYGEQQLNLNIQSNELINNSSSQLGDEDREPQSAIHPAVQKLIAKRPRELHHERLAARNAITTIKQKIRKPMYKNQYKQKFKHHPEGILENMGTKQNMKTNDNHDLNSTITSDELDSNLTITSDVSIPLKAVTANRLNNKTKYLICVGNTSKYICNDMDKELKQASSIFTHKWLVYVTSKEPKTPLEHYVRKIRFHLHDSYRPNNVVDVMHPPFQLSRFGWGEFPIRIQLYFHSHFYEKPIQFEHHIVLDKNHTGLDTIGAETTVEIWLRNILHKEHKMPTEDSIVAESSNDGMNDIATTDICSELTNNSTESRNNLENKSTSNEIIEAYANKQEQSKQHEDQQYQTLQNNTTFAPSTDCWKEPIATDKAVTIKQTNDISKSTELVTANDYGSNTTEEGITTTSHSNCLENNVTKIDASFEAKPSASVCQSRINNVQTTKLMNVVFTTTVSTTGLVHSTSANTVKPHISSVSNVTNSYKVVSSTSASRFSNALHCPPQHFNSSKICYLRPVNSGGVVSVPKTMQTMLYPRSTTDANSVIKNNVNLNVKLNNDTTKSALLNNGAPISMISVKPTQIQLINPANTSIANTITLNSNTRILQQQQPKQLFPFLQNNTVQCTNTFSNLKYVPLLTVSKANLNRNVNNQPYQQFVIKKQPKINENCKEEVKPIAIQTNSMLIKQQQGNSEDITIPKSKPIMLTVKLPNSLLNKQTSSNCKAIANAPAEDTKASSALQACEKTNKSADNLLIMQPNLITNKTNSSSIISMKNIIIQKEGKLCLIDPIQTKLKQQQQGKQVSLLKPGMSLLNQQHQRSKQYFAFEDMTGNPHRLEQMFLKQTFPTIQSAVNYLLKRIKLITKSKLEISMFPFVSQSLAEFESLNAVKQRSREWLRAKTISRLLRKHSDLQQLQRKGESVVWSIREIAVYARHYAYTPTMKVFNAPKTAADNSLKTNKKMHNLAALVKNELQKEYQKDNIIDTTTDQSIVLKWLENAWQKLNIYQQQMEDAAFIDIEIDSPSNPDQGNNSSTIIRNRLCKEQALMRKDDVLLQTPVELQHELELCSHFLQNFNIHLKPEKISENVWHSMAHVLLAHCLHSFIDKLVRQSIAFKIKQQYNGRKPKSAMIPNEYSNMEAYTLEVEDIVRALRTNYADFDFLTNRNFGTIHFKYFQAKE